jgi:hypothetical protein
VYLEKLRQYIELKAEYYGGDESVKEDLDNMRQSFVQRPMCLDPHDPGNVVKKSEEQLAEMIAVMEDNGTTNAGQLSEFDFYSRCRYLKKKFEPVKEK